MNAYNNFPIFPGYPPYFQPQIQQPQQPAPQTAQPQTHTVEVVPVKSESAARDFPVGLGATQMMLAEDDSFIAVKGVSVSGQVSFDLYVKRPPAPPAPVFDPSEYIRKDEFETRLAAFLAAQKEAEK